MMRISVGVTVLAALIGTYVVNPTAGWVVLFATSTLAFARHIRQRDERTERAILLINR